MEKDAPSHIGLWVLMILLIGFTIWSSFIKRTEQNEYSKGASHNESTFNVYETPLSFPCGKFFAYDPEYRKNRTEKK